MRLKVQSTLMVAVLSFLWAFNLSAQGQDAGMTAESVQDDVKSSYIESRWIGLLDIGVKNCPKIAGWTDKKLLDQALGDASLDRQAIPPADVILLQAVGFDRFCTYTKVQGAVEKFPQRLTNGLIRAERDRMAISPSADPTLDTTGNRIWRDLAEGFYRQAGKVELVPSEKSKVHVVFLDTQMTGEGVPTSPGRSWHGYTMANLANQLICGDVSPCPISFGTRLALRYNEAGGHVSETASEEGGNLGAISELARAVVAAVESWRAEHREQKLILNLSIGWDGELLEKVSSGKSDLDARKVSGLELSVQAVYQALRVAEKHGVLVIAAAGNRRGGSPKTSWPVLPAAWQLRRPSFWPWKLGTLVYAVGGVDWQGLPLPNSRHKGMPEIVAYGDHAVTVAGARGGPTPIYTGSSVSTVVVSSVAAVVWQAWPELTSAKVMDLIKRTSDELESKADFYSWEKVRRAPGLKRASLCRAVQQACRERGGKSCPVAGSSCASWDPHARDLSTNLASLETTSVGSFVPSTGTYTPPCDPIMRLLTPGGRDLHTRPCPMEELLDLESIRWVYPQPEDNPCPSCVLIPPPHRMSALADTSVELVEKPYYLAGTIMPGWSVASAALDVDCYVAGERSGKTTYAIPRGALYQRHEGRNNGVQAGLGAPARTKVARRVYGYSCS